MELEKQIETEEIDLEKYTKEDKANIRKASWLCELFHEYKLNVKDKQEVLKRLCDKLNQDAIKEFQKRNLDEILRKKHAS
jgi:ATP-dependent Lon protease